MKHIAMLTCLNANAVCTGASCLKAFYDRTGSFAIYQTEALYLDAFMKCNGCGNPPNTDHGMLEKIERLKQLGTQIVHVGICARKKDGTECSNIGTKRNENRKRNTLRFQRKSDTDVSLFFIFIYKQFGTY